MQNSGNENFHLCFSFYENFCVTNFVAFTLYLHTDVAVDKASGGERNHETNEPIGQTQVKDGTQNPQSDSVDNKVCIQNVWIALLLFIYISFNLLGM